MNQKKILSELVSISSVFGQEYKAGVYIERLLRQMGFSVQRQTVSEKQFNILAEKGHGKSLLLFGHLDTVPVKEGWETDPITLTQKGDRLYGLGAWDMKGGISAMLSAVNGLEPGNFTLKLAFVVDEENISLGMHTLISSGWLKDVSGAISPEPGFQYGLQGVALGRIGRSVYVIAIHTDGGHVYLANERTNAISQAAEVMRLLEKIKVYRHSKLGESFLFPRFISGGAQAMAIPDTVVLEVESQLVPPQTTTSLLDEISNIINKATSEGRLKANIEVNAVSRPTPFCEPYIIDENNQFVVQTSQILAQIVGRKPVYYYRRSVADENRVASLGIPALTIGAAGGNAHEADEWVSEKSLLLLREFFCKLLDSQNEV